MLLQLNIKNFAIIENLSISFEKGFNVLLGETGAGKSILIDAIQYVLGEKFDKKSIRNGENKTYVEAIFTVENDNLKKILEQMDIIVEDDLLIISRETFQSGKNIAKINGKSILISQLKSVTKNLLDIHGQNKNLTLLDNNVYIDYIDNYGKKELQVILDEYKKYYNELQSIDYKISNIKGEVKDRDKVIDFLKYQIDEINNSNLKIGEDIEIEEKVKQLSNYEKITKLLRESINLLHNGEDNSYSISYALSKVIKNFREIQNDIGSFKKTADSIEEMYFNLESISEDIISIDKNMYFDENELEQLNRRIYEIENYKRKYGKTIEEIFNYRDSIQKKYNNMINSEAILKELNDKKNLIMQIMNKSCDKINKIRCSIAYKLEDKIKQQLNYIGLEKSQIKFQITKTNTFNSKGKDNVEFIISTNPGMPMQHLSKIVSGGELSRIMLAIKTVFVDNDKIPSIIFDEIDTGISGRIAQKVGEKMYIISKCHQVFCITHLPQIAALSENLYLVSKHSDNNNTFTCINKLSPKQKILEIAKMINGFNVTELSLKNAREIIDLANKQKMNI